MWHFNRVSPSQTIRASYREVLDKSKHLLLLLKYSNRQSLLPGKLHPTMQHTSDFPFRWDLIFFLTHYLICQFFFKIQRWAKNKK